LHVLRREGGSGHHLAHAVRVLGLEVLERARARPLHHDVEQQPRKLLVLSRQRVRCIAVPALRASHHQRPGLGREGAMDALQLRLDKADRRLVDGSRLLRPEPLALEDA
jgi:hypothetical protein